MKDAMHIRGEAGQNEKFEKDIESFRRIDVGAAVIRL